MASFDNDKRNWGNYSSESMNNREDAKSRRSAKPNVEIYRPGSGPLKRTSHGEGDTSNNDKQRITPEKSTLAVADSGKNARKPNFEHRDKKGDVKASEKITAAVADSAKNARKPNFEHNDKKGDVKASEKTTAAVVDSAKNMKKQNSEHNDEKIKVPERDKRNTEKGIRDIVDETKNIRISDSSASNHPRSEGRQRFKKPGQVLYVPKACNQVNSERVVLNTVKDASSKPTVTQKFKNDEVSGTRKYNMGSNGKKPACVYSTLEKQQNISSNTVKKSEVVKDRPCEWAEENWDEDEDDEVKKTVNVTQPVENLGRKQEPVNTTKKSFEKPVSSVMDHGIKSSGSFRSKDANSKNFRNNSDWRAESPSFSRGSDFRHGSEPRSLPPDLHRMRDTRSVEPTDKKHIDKPPSGRRGSLRDGNAKGYHPSYESLPPRFQKKYLTENAIKKVNPERNYLEDSWDGNSIVFQGNSNNNNNPTHHVPPVQAWTHTYPNRGRGRLKPHELEFDRIIVNAVKYGQSLSQEKSLVGNFGQEMGLTSVQNINNFLVRENLPVTRQHHALLEDRSGPNLRMRNISTKTDIPETTTVEASKNVTTSTISKEEISQSAKDSSFQVSPKVLDWSEEVEQSERLAAAGSGGSAPDVTAPSIENDKSSRSQRTKEKRKRRKRDSTSNENFSNVEDDDKGENSRHKEWDKCEVERRHDGRGRSNRYEDKDNGRTNHSKDQNDKYDKRDDHNQNRNTRQRRDSRREYSLERSGRKERNYSLGRNSNRGNRPPSLDRYNDRSGRQYDRDRQRSKDRRYNNRSDRQPSQEREYNRGFNQERSNNIEAAPHNKNWSLRNRHGSLERNHDKGYPDDGSRDSYSDRNDNKGNRARSNERNYNQGYKPPSGDIKNDKLKNPPPTGQRRNDDRDIRNHSQERRNYRDARRTSCDRSESSYRGSRPSSRERYNKPFARNVPSRESSWDRSRVHPGWDRRSSYDSDSISLSHERNIDYNSHSRYQSDFDDRLSWRRDSIHSLKDGSSREFCQTRSQNEGNDNNNWREQNMLRRDAEVKSSSQFSSFDKNSEGKRSDTEECLSRADVKSWRDAVERDDDRDTRNIPSAQDINQIEKLSLSTSVSESRVRGIIMLPNQLSAADIAIVQPTMYPRFPSVNAVIPSCSVVYSPKNAVGSLHHASAPQQHILFNHIDPSKPITVSTRSNRSVPQGFESFRQGQNQPAIMMDVDRLQNDLQLILNNGYILREWNQIMYYRQLLQNCLITLLMKDIKFCETKNMEHHFWKILFYDIIELLRKAMKDNEDNKDLYKGTLLTVIDEGTVYYESLIDGLEKTYKFKLDDILHTNVTPNKDLGYVSVALHSIQKILLFLGDLARYKEQINESSNFGKSRQYYIKAHQINPKNGRPYNQLAVLAGYVKRKIDAVYYYMRSLMASIPVQSARENLLPMFEDSRKKYEQFERKRRDERERKRRESMKDKESASLRREYWIHPDGTRPRLHITSTVHDMREEVESGDDDLSTLTSSEINKRFIITYLNVQGKLFTKIGMETFQETAIHMLREFRALLQHSPLPLNANRLLQLLALNMFAIENTQLKDGGRLESSYRSAIQENALIVSLQMFSLILEKCVALLKDQLNSYSNSEDPSSSSRLVLGEDILVLLPPVKVWCDWLLCHTKVWNPPPSCADFRVGPPGDPWSRMASLVNLLEKLPLTEVDLLTECREGYEVVRLPEDATLYGFTPLMSITQEPVYVRKDADMEEAQLVLRIRKIIFFGTVYLCGVDPPVLKLQKYDTGHSEYISIVASYSQQSYSPVDEQSDSEIQVESFSEDEGVGSGKGTEDYPDLSDSVSTPEEIRSLLHRKEELERRHQRQEKHRKHVQAILRETVVSIEIEVKPRCLVPDTNCFIDYLPQLQKITQAKSSEQQQPLYCLMVPLVVLKELEGLTRGGKDRDFIPLPDVSPEHAFQVAEKAKAALSFLRSKHPGVRCVTTKGTVLALTTCIMEEDTEPEQRNDDRILSTCLSLCHMKEHQNPGEPRRLYREVVLLTEDRNLRVKALARYVPVREVSDFMQWADLG